MEKERECGAANKRRGNRGDEERMVEESVGMEKRTKCGVLVGESED